MESMIEPHVAVIGIGGAGCNVLNKIYWADGSFDTIAINTDKVSLRQTPADKKVCLCKDITKGEGTKGDILLAETCAKAHSDEIAEAIKAYDTIFIVAGLGGGTGSGVAPVVAGIAHSLGIITFTVAIKPFAFETARLRSVRETVSKIRMVCPMTVIIENDKALSIMADATMKDAFTAIDQGVVNFIVAKRDKIAGIFVEEMKKIDTGNSSSHTQSIPILTPAY